MSGAVCLALLLVCASANASYIETGFRGHLGSYAENRIGGIDSLAALRIGVEIVASLELHSGIGGPCVRRAPGVGVHWDPDVGLSYAQQRWYDPRVGRFLSEDPVFGQLSEPMSLHRFAYANGNPVRYVDPMGLWAFGTMEQIPSYHKKEWRVVTDERQKAQISQAMELARQWLQKEAWVPSAAKVAKKWNSLDKNADRTKHISEEIFRRYNRKVLEELVENALVFELVAATGGGQSADLGERPYKIALRKVLYPTNNPITLEEVAIPKTYAGTVVHELLHHYAKWGHTSSKPWEDPNDPVYWIASLIAKASGQDHFGYSEGTWH